MNLQIQRLKEAISKSINESKLPAAVVDMVIGEFKIQTQAQAAYAISLERKAEEGEKNDGQSV